MQKLKLLVIEAHSDDSCISIGGFLEKNRDHYEYHFGLVVSSDIMTHHQGLLTRDQRLEEYRQYVQYFNGHWHMDAPLPFDADARLHTTQARYCFGY